MTLIRLVIILISVEVTVFASSVYNATLDTEEAPRPVRDRFMLIKSNINEERTNDEIQDFTAYGCEKMVVIRNKAQEEFIMHCDSYYGPTKSTIIQPGNSYTFTFKRRKNGHTRFWCQVNYKNHLVEFDVYNEGVSYTCPRDKEEIYEYIVHHDGIYIKKKDNYDEKIRALMKGHNKFSLWEEFEDGESDGLLVSGYVDGGMCYNVPGYINDKTASVTVCDNHCLLLFENIHCRGKVQTVQANGSCIDVGLNEELKGQLTAVKGC